MEIQICFNKSRTNDGFFVTKAEFSMAARAAKRSPGKTESCGDFLKISDKNICQPTSVNIASAFAIFEAAVQIAVETGSWGCETLKLVHLTVPLDIPSDSSLYRQVFPHFPTR